MGQVISSLRGFFDKGREWKYKWEGTPLSLDTITKRFNKLRGLSTVTPQTPTPRKEVTPTDVSKPTASYWTTTSYWPSPRQPLKRTFTQISGCLPNVFEDIFARKKLRLDDSENKKKEKSIGLKVVPQYLDFAYLINKDVVEYIGFSKVLFLMRGLQGSGKSTIVRHLEEKYPSAVTYSADHFFMQEGKYVFDPTKLGEAHELCQQNTITAARNQISVIIIDNTCLQEWETAFYIKLAKEYHYVVALVEPKTPWARNPRVLAEKNTHSIDQDMIEKRLNTFREIYPLYYCFMFNEKDSSIIRQQACLWLTEAYRYQEFIDDMQNSYGVEGLQGLMDAFGALRSNDLLHCTSKYTGKGRADGAHDYMEDEHVANSLFHLYDLEIYGFVLTPRTVGARVRLSQGGLRLWGGDDNESIPDYFYFDEDFDCDNGYIEGGDYMEYNEVGLEEDGQASVGPGKETEVIVEQAAGRDVEIETYLNSESNAGNPRKVGSVNGENSLQSVQNGFSKNTSEGLENERVTGFEHGKREVSSMHDDKVGNEMKKITNGDIDSDIEDIVKSCFHIENGYDKMEVDEVESESHKVGSDKIINKESFSTKPKSTFLLKRDALGSTDESDSELLFNATETREAKRNLAFYDSSENHLGVNGGLVREENDQHRFNSQKQDKENVQSSSLVKGSETSVVHAGEPSPMSFVNSRFGSSFSNKPKKSKIFKRPQPKSLPIPPNDLPMENSSVKPTCRFVANELSPNIEQFDNKGARAHLTLAVAEEVKPVTTGLDALFVSILEKKGTASISLGCGGAEIKNYGNGVWIITPQEKIVVTSPFVRQF